MSSPDRRTTRSGKVITPVSTPLKRARSSQDVSKRSAKRQKCTPTVEAVIEVQDLSTPTKSHQVFDPVTPLVTPTRPSQRSFYAHARSLLRLSSDPNQSKSLPLLGRDAQREQILSFLSENAAGEDFELRKGGALYISGRPGTGKTALVTDILEHSMENQGSKLFVNCAAVKGVQVWQVVLDAVCGSASGLNGLRARRKLEEVIQEDDQQPFLLVLDEIDHLSQTNLLQSLFTLAGSEKSKLTLIGIANTLDLSSKLSTDNVNLQAINFPPYDAKDMVSIAKQRLNLLHENDSASFLPLIAPPALELISRKVAANTGDLRSFLAVVRKAIEFAEPSPYPVDLTLSTAPKATPAHALKALKACSLSSSNGNSSARLTAALTLAGGLQSRLALTALCIALERSRQALTPSSSPAAKKSSIEVSIETAWAVYNSSLRQASREEMIQSRSDWENLLDNLSANALVKVEVSTRSSPSPNSKKTKTSSPRKGERVVGLMFDLKETIESVRNCQASAEVSAIAGGILDAEKKLQGRKARVWDTNESAPMRGFNGDGLEGRENEMLGDEKRSTMDSEEM